MLDDGQLLTENVAILCWVAERAPRLAPGGELGQIRLIEMLAFVATELDKPLIRVIFPTSDAEKESARTIIGKRFDFIADRLAGDYLFGRECSVVPEPLPALFDRVEARPAVRLALQNERLA